MLELSHMKNTQRGFVVPLLVGIIALLLVGGGAYYVTRQQSVVQIPENNTDSSASQKPQSAAQPTPGTPITLITTDICSPEVKDGSTLLFTDKNRKVWTVNYSKATFTNYGNVSKTVQSTTLQDWLKSLYRVGQPKAEFCGAPGTITVTGALVGSTVFASHIELVGQG